MEALKENKMGTMPVLRLLVTMSLPSMISMLVQALYNIVDSYYVAQISEEALTAVTLAFPAQMLMGAVAIGTSVGINSLIARSLGAKQQGQADSAATHSILLAAFGWAVFAVLGGLFSGTFISAFTNTQAIAEMGTQYLTICTMASLGMFVEINMEKTLQATGNMIFPMLFQLTGAIVNIILDPIMIFGWLGLPAMGVAGAAVATVIAQWVGMIFALLVVVLRKHDVHISFRKFRWSWNVVKQIYAVGLPAIIMQSIGSLMNVAVNAILIGFTETAVAVFGVYFKLQSFIFMPVFGLTHGVLPIIGYNYGARNKKRMLAALRYAIIIAVSIMAIGTLIFMLFPDFLLGIFNASDNMLEIGRIALRTISICFVPAALGIMVSTMFQALGRGIYSMLTSIMRQLVVLIPAAYLLSFIGLSSVWYAFPIAEVVSMLTSLVFLRIVYRKYISHLEDGHDTAPSIGAQGETSAELEAEVELAFAEEGATELR